MSEKFLTFFRTTSYILSMCDFWIRSNYRNHKHKNAFDRLGADLWFCEILRVLFIATLSMFLGRLFVNHSKVTKHSGFTILCPLTWLLLFFVGNPGNGYLSPRYHRCEVRVLCKEDLTGLICYSKMVHDLRDHWLLRSDCAVWAESSLFSLALYDLWAVQSATSEDFDFLVATVLPCAGLFTCIRNEGKMHMAVSVSELTVCTLLDVECWDQTVPLSLLLSPLRWHQCER